MHEAFVPGIVYITAVEKGFLALLIFSLLLFIGHVIEVYTLNGSPKLFWNAKLNEKKYVKSFSPKFFPFLWNSFPNRELGVAIRGLGLCALFI